MTILFGVLKLNNFNMKILLNCLFLFLNQNGIVHLYCAMAKWNLQKEKLCKMDKKKVTSLLELIHKSTGDLPPKFVGMKFIRYVKEGTGPDSDFSWAIYISHDPCHDHENFLADKNTVIAFHRKNGSFRLIGRELPMKLALSIAESD